MCASDRVLRAGVAAQVWLAQRQRALLSGDEGQSLVEYSIMLCFISALVISIMLTMGNQAGNILSNISAKLGQSPAN